MSADTSDCTQRFGHADFDTSRLTTKAQTECPIKGCSTALEDIRFGKSIKPFCPTHGIRLHSNTFVYWNGSSAIDGRLRNFVIRPDLAAKIALDSVEKAESHRLGYEMSEDALTWNIFVGLADAGKLHRAVKFLTDREIDIEPRLYLWGELIDVKAGSRQRFEPLTAVRGKLERGIKRFKTEPDVLLVADSRLIISIEAKFGSGNTLAHAGIVKDGEKPTDRARLIERYLDPASDRTKSAIVRDAITDNLHSQLFRNVIFASEMADGADWHVVNLVSSTQWPNNRESRLHSYLNPEPTVLKYLNQYYQRSFTFRTWEQLYYAVLKNDDALDSLAHYMQFKSAHYWPAFDLN